MSPRAALIASLLAVSIGIPTATQAEVRWEGGEPIFSPRETGRYARQRSYDTQRGYYQDRRGYSYEPRWGFFGQGWGYDPRWQGYDPRYQGLDQRQYPRELTGGPRPNVAPRAPQTVAFANNETAGTVIIDTSARKLYYTLSQTEAYAYPISVGREGFTWTGTENISRIADWPDWYPPEEMRQRQPGLPVKMTGGLNNPLGVKALYLGDTLYRIHGTNDAKTIGQAASSGCFRMLNAHVVHLASVVDVGTTVKVVKRYPSGGFAVTAKPSETAAAKPSEAVAAKPSETTAEQQSETPAEQPSDTAAAPAPASQPTAAQ